MSEPPRQIELKLTDGQTVLVWQRGSRITWGSFGECEYNVHPSELTMDATMRHVAIAMGSHLESWSYVPSQR
jgi:hypothetical protein